MPRGARSASEAEDAGEAEEVMVVSIEGGIRFAGPSLHPVVQGLHHEAVGLITVRSRQELNQCFSAGKDSSRTAAP